MKCSAALEQIASPAQPTHELLNHIAECPGCRQSFVAAQRVSEFLGQPIYAPSRLVEDALRAEVAPFGPVMNWRQIMKRNTLPIAATTLAIALVAIMIPRQASAAPDPIEKMRGALKRVAAVHTTWVDNRGQTVNRWTVEGKDRFESSSGAILISTPGKTRFWMNGKEQKGGTVIQKHFQPSNVLEDHIRAGLTAKDLGFEKLDGESLHKIEILVPGQNAQLGGVFGQGKPPQNVSAPDQRLTFLADDAGLPRALRMEIKKDGQWTLLATYRYEYLESVPDSWFEGLERP